MSEPLLRIGKLTKEFPLKGGLFGRHVARSQQALHLGVLIAHDDPHCVAPLSETGFDEPDGIQHHYTARR